MVGVERAKDVRKVSTIECVCVTHRRWRDLEMMGEKNSNWA